MRDSIDRIRSATFPVARKGYDTREVDRYLSRLADWLEAGGDEQARSDTVKRELERIGQKTAKILTSAQDAADQLRTEASHEAEDLLAEAKRDAEQSRSDADKYAGETRAGADKHSEQTRSAAERHSAEVRAAAESQGADIVKSAEAEARKTVAEGQQRRRDVEAVIADLEERRDAVLAGVERIEAELAGTLAQHRPAPGGNGGAEDDAKPPAAKPKAPAKSQ